MPFLLFFTALCIGATFFIADVPAGRSASSCSSSRTSPTRRRSSTTTRRSRSCQLPGDARQAVRDRDGIGYFGTVFVGLLIFVLDVPVEDRFRLTAVLFALFAIPIFLFVREPHRPDGPAGHRGATSATRSASSGGRSPTRGEVPGLCRFLLGRFFYSDAVNTVIVVMSVVIVKILGLSEQRRQPRPAVAHARGDRR